MGHVRVEVAVISTRNIDGEGDALDDRGQQAKIDRVLKTAGVTIRNGNATVRHREGEIINGRPGQRAAQYQQSKADAYSVPHRLGRSIFQPKLSSFYHGQEVR